MAAKSPKKPRAKAPAKKVQHKASRKAKASPQPAMVPDGVAEIVTEAPDLMPPEVRKQLDSVEKLLGKAETLTDPAILKSIRDYASQAERHRGVAVQAGASAIVFAWACGNLLKAAKKKLGHGSFGTWWKENLSKLISKRTAARYMQLAERCSDLRGLLEWSPSLRQAYIECGILPTPEKQAGDRDSGTDDGEETKLKQRVLEGLSDVQKNLRHADRVIQNLSKNLTTMKASKVEFDAVEKEQVSMVKDEIIRFFKNIEKLLPR